MKHFFTFLFLSFNFVFFSQNIKISEQHSKNQNDNFDLNKDANQAILYAHEDIEVSSKLIEKYLDQGFEVILKTKKNIEISAPIFYERNQKGILKFISEDTGTIQITNLAKIVSTKSRLDFIVKTQGNIKINPSTQIQTNGGDIQLKAFKQTQKIKRYATSSTVIDGTLDASAIYGGKITIESDDINIGATARILSTGANGGGKILIGGDWQGGTVQNKRESEAIYESIGVHVAEGALIDASAKYNGNGGKVVVWSNIDHPKSNTEVKGQLLAMGGKYAGKGGMIETSGGAVDFEKVKVSTIASDGSAGEWLIDPYNFYFNATHLSTLASNLNSNNITISTWSSGSTHDPSAVCGDGHVVFLSDFSYSGSSARTLTINTHRDIWINGNITSTGGGLSLEFNASSGRRVLINGNITTNGGAVTVGNAASIHFQKTSGTQMVNTNGGAINFGNSNVKLLRHSGTLTLNTGSGLLSLGGSGTIDQINSFFSYSSTLIYNGWGGAHSNWDNVTGGTNSGIRSYGANNIVSGREYSVRLWFWDSWDGEGGELIVRLSNNTPEYYFRGFRTHNSGITNHNGFSRSSYLISGESSIGRGSWNDQFVDITFVAQHNGTLQTYTSLNQDINDESLELFNIWETQISENTNYTSGSRSLELISTSGQLACGTKNFSGLANITFNTNNDWGFVEGIISGATNVTKSGTGRVRFSGRNDYTGTTTVSAGTFRFAPWFTTNVALSGAFTNNGIVTYETDNINNRPTIYLDGGISGNGTWNISSDVAPATIWNNRLSFRINASTSGQINISSHGNLWLEGSNINMTSPIFIDGANARLRLYGPANTTMTTGQITGTGTVDFADGAGGQNITLAINTGSSNHQFGGIFANSGTSSGPTVLNIRKNGSGTYTLTGNNTYTGTTTISGGILQLGNNGTTGSISTGNIVNNGTLSINRSDNITLANAISGTGIVNKLNNTTATFTNNNTYTGATNITGTLVLQNNAPTSSSTTYQGAGQLRIESAGNDFTSTFSTSGWTFDSTITGLTIGKTVNTANINIGSVTKIAGPISVYGGTITAAENISTSVANATILLKGTADINLSASKQISTNNAPVILWANSDGQTTNGMVDFDLDATITTNGGPIWIGGGSGTTSWNGLTVGNGYAVSGKTVVSPVSGSADWIAGVSFKRNTLNSNGGDIAIYGQSNQTLGIGVCTHRNVSFLSGNGKITIEGHNAQSDARNGFLWGMHNGNIGSETSLVTFNSSSNTNNGHAIYLNASLGNSNRAAAGLNQLRLNATGSASVYIKGVNNGGGIGLQLGTAEILASSGSIQVETGASTLDGGFGQFDVPNTGTSSIGFKTGSAITSSSSNITIIANALTNLTNLNFRTTGTLTIRPQDNGSFSNTINTNTFTYSSGISGLTIGTPTNTSRINFASVTNIAGPILAYGDTLAVNENILSSNGSSISLFGNALIIGSDKTVTSNNGQLIIAPRTASNTIGLGGASGSLSLPASYFSTNFSDGFSNIQIGSNSQTGAISTNAFTLRDHMTFLTSGSLTLGGKPVLGNNNITLGTGITTIHVGSPANYFQTNGSGTVIRSIANNTNLLFPVGRIAYNPISVNNKTGTTDTFSVNVLDTAYLNGSSGGTISSNYVKRTWNISKNTASANAGSGVDFSFTWNADEVVGSLANPTLNHHNGSSWEIPTMGTSSISGTTLTYTGYKGTFSPFAIGGSSIFALPVELKEFKATCQSDYIQIDWTTASEIRNKAFELFNSEDAHDWKLIYTTEGQGDKATETQYAFNDLDKKPGYYRLKDIDEDGIENWSQIIFADCKNEISGIQIYPNPASDFIKVIVPKFENTTLKIINLEGKIIKTIPLISNQTLIPVKELASGIYIIEISPIENKLKFIKK